MGPVTIVVITRNRRAELLDNLDRLTVLPEVAEVIVVDNGSQDGTADAVRGRFPTVTVLPQPTNLGAAGRTVGVRAAATEVVAFADDDSWWDPGALGRAAALFAAEPRLGLLHARLLVEPGGAEDPLCRLLAAGLREPGAAGPTVTGHLACAVAVRRTAYLEAGGYHRLLGVGGEERLLALDLAAAGWHQWYVDELVARHRPSRVRESGAERDARVRRNDLLTTWLRLPWQSALAETRRYLADAREQPPLRRETAALVRAVPAVIAERRVVPPRVLQLLAATAERQPGPPAR